MVLIPTVAVVVVVALVAELVRSGVGNLPNGQREASLALGLTRTQSLMEIEVPQAIYACLLYTSPSPRD